MENFFDAPPQKSRNSQTELRVDMALAYSCMGAGHGADRQIAGSIAKREG